VKPPLSWFGGKTIWASRILPYLPPHHTYVEPFGGSAAILFAKPRSPVEVYNDLDRDLVDFFLTVRDDVSYAELYKLLMLTPYSRAEFYMCRETWQDYERGLERVRRWYVAAEQSFTGTIYGRKSSWGLTVGFVCRGIVGSVARWQARLSRIEPAHRRLRGVIIECRDWREILSKYDGEDTLFYLDPPYAPDTRTRHGVYAHELSPEDHKELVDTILTLRGMVVLSGYQSDVYTPLTHNGWRLVSWETSSFAAARTRHTGILGESSALSLAPRTECLWIKPSGLGRLL